MIKKAIPSLVLSIALVGCSQSSPDLNTDQDAQPEQTGLTQFDKSQVPTAPDYTSQTGWAALPENPNEYPVDVFWVYPTIFGGDTTWLMNTQDLELQAAAKGTLDTQASVFNGQANIYAPYYRQMNMEALSLDQATQSEIQSYGEDDVLKSFQYYLKHHNKGKPYIIAGHSQGSNDMTNVAIKNWGEMGHENNLIAAYLIGWSFTPEDQAKNPAIKVCQSATETGCFIWYNSVADGLQDQAPTLVKGTWVTNPLTWESSLTNGEIAPASENIGAVFFDDKNKPTEYPNFTSAQIKDSGLVCNVKDASLVSNADNPTFSEGVYHKHDYSLFYDNLKTNIADRIRAFLEKQ